ncbi:hypothetical protein M422DRAFT_31559 [Sphaerobolus stellatus SS14]|uniref:Uncharacterized protein n=1 Tax=Sphaerobolus stellatus (strain SS14) TaxID=990650 RepID=A0A0C9VJZ9_SPHS4|nr:hypothetical protein M422DRAFT_31559 [Sphaerobolus stellatus SS14]
MLPYIRVFNFTHLLAYRPHLYSTVPITWDVAKITPSPSGGKHQPFYGKHVPIRKFTIFQGFIQRHPRLEATELLNAELLLSGALVEGMVPSIKSMAFSRAYSFYFSIFTPAGVPKHIISLCIGQVDRSLFPYLKDIRALRNLAATIHLDHMDTFT